MSDDLDRKAAFSKLIAHLDPDDLNALQGVIEARRVHHLEKQAQASVQQVAITTSSLKPVEDMNAISSNKVPKGAEHVQKAWLEMQKKGWEVQPTSGEGLMCGIYALAIAISAVIYEDIPDYVIVVPEARKAIASHLSGILRSDKYTELVIQHEAAIYTGGNVTPTTNDFGLHDKDTLWVGQLALILQLYCEGISRELCLGVWSVDSVYFTAEKQHQAQDMTVAWVRHEGYNHWAGIAPNLVTAYTSNAFEDSTVAPSVQDSTENLTASSLQASFNKFPSKDQDDPSVDDSTENPQDGVKEALLSDDFEDAATGEKVTGDTTLVRLFNPQKNDPLWKRIKPTFTHTAWFVTQTGLVPQFSDDQEYDWDGINLKWSIALRDVAPCIRLTFKIYQKEKKVHGGMIEFYFGKIEGKGRGVSDLRYEYRNEGATRRMLLSWKTDGGVGQGLSIPQSLETVSQISDTMAALHRCLAACEMKLALSIGENELVENFETFLKELPTNDSWEDPSNRPWSPYLHKSGEPEFSFGRTISRKELINKGLPWLPYDARPIFVDSREAEIKLCYGALQEHYFAMHALRDLERAQHKVSFLYVGDHVLARITLSKAPELEGGRLKIQDQTMFDLTYTTPYSSAIQECSAFTIDNTLSIPGADLLLVVANRDVLSFGRIITSYNSMENSTWFNVQLDAKGNNAGFRRQVSAVHTLCSVKQSMDRRWWPVLLNQNLQGEEASDPTEVVNNPDMVDKAMDTILRVLPWNPEQIATFVNARKMISRLLLIQGPAGTGKTLLIVALAAFYNLCGLHVLMTAPSHVAANVIVEKYIGLFPDYEQPLRVNQPLFEGQVRLTATIDDVDAPKTEALSKKTPEPMTTPPADQKQDAEEADLVLLSVINSVKNDTAQKTFELNKFSLRNRVLEVAGKHSLRLIRAYGVGDDVDGQMDGPTGPEVDMWDEFRKYHTRVMEEPMQTWEDDDRENFVKAYRYIRRQVISLSHLLVTTTNNAACEDVRGSFGGDEAIGVVVIQDEAAMEIEPNAWVPIIKGQWAHKIVGWIMCGDELQLAPTVLSGQGGNSYNEHAATIRNALFARLRVQYFKTNELLEQNRMHAAVADGPNKLIYGGRLRNGPATRNRRLTKMLENFLRQYLQVTKPGEDLLRASVIDVPNGVAQVNPQTLSRYNLENVEVVMDLLMKLRPVISNQRENIYILVPYRDQRRVYMEKIYGQARKLNLPLSEFPRVMTIDSSQGNEAYMVIFDTVISQAKRSSDLGFMKDSRRLNSACTRGADVLLFVGNGAVLDGNLNTVYKFKELGATKKRVRATKPYLIAYMDLLWKRNAWVTKDIEQISETSKVL
ncbi:MAG: hypothetical protein M1830_010793 [Pleopsidium flavum]|nr:MAG: hypothetical protein M1830_010793 [Pleopsidium flavum]